MRNLLKLFMKKMVLISIFLLHFIIYCRLDLDENLISELQGGQINLQPLHRQLEDDRQSLTNLHRMGNEPFAGYPSVEDRMQQEGEERLQDQGPAEGLQPFGAVPRLHQPFGAHINNRLADPKVN